MSLESDLQRNRKIFELLTGSGNVTYETTETRREPISPPAAGTLGPSAPKAFEYTPQDSGTFSLGLGKMASRETGIALSFVPPEGVGFPELSPGAAESRADPVESLYRQLEIEARRSSQLLCEEEF